MNWNLLGQYSDVVLAFLMVLSLAKLNLQGRYLAVLVFIVFDGLQSLLFIVFKYWHLVDYRIFAFVSMLLTWCTTIWVVYALLIAILQQLPGILRFSLRFLNVIFAGWIAISLLTVRPEWNAYGAHHEASFLSRLTVASHVLNRAFALAEILVIISILVFVLRFPIRVPTNLAAFSAALSIYLCAQVTADLLLTYAPPTRHSQFLANIPPIVMSGCLIYWLFSIDKAGEVSQATLGPRWQSVPKEHLVHQLEALNAALLRSQGEA